MNCKIDEKQNDARTKESNYNQEKSTAKVSDSDSSTKEREDKLTESRIEKKESLNEHRENSAIPNKTRNKNRETEIQNGVNGIEIEEINDKSNEARNKDSTVGITNTKTKFNTEKANIQNRGTVPFANKRPKSIFRHDYAMINRMKNEKKDTLRETDMQVPEKKLLNKKRGRTKEKTVKQNMSDDNKKEDNAKKRIAHNQQQKKLTSVVKVVIPKDEELDTERTEKFSLTREEYEEIFREEEQEPQEKIIEDKIDSPYEEMERLKINLKNK